MMKCIHGGTFRMGSFAGLSDEKPEHSVTVSDFYMDEYEVTQKDWKELTGKSPSYFSDAPDKGEIQERRPVECISEYDAFVFCNMKSIREGLTPCYTLNGKDDCALWGAVPAKRNAQWDDIVCRWDADGYRLPTEAEWEYAACSGKKDGYARIRKEDSEKYAWSMACSWGMTHEIGKKEPNAFGLYDMFGNVWERCWDWYSCYKPAPAVNPHGPEHRSDSGVRMIRGGGWNSEFSDCSAGFRNSGDPAERFNFAGLRLVKKA